MGRFTAWAILVLFCVLALLQAANAQSTEITYQGQLQSSSSPANGSYDFEFVLYDGGGAQIGPSLARNGVAVANGIFSVKLDFGANFPGATRLLEIHVRPAGVGGFTTLSPRQSITSSPYSIKTISADFATNAQTAVSATNFSGNLAGDVTGPQTATVVNAVGGQSANSIASAVQAANAATADNTPNTLVKRDPLGNLSVGSITGSLVGNASSATNASQLGGVAASAYLQTTGNGAGLTNLNAGSIATGTLDAARLPVPLTLAGSSATHIIRGENTSTLGTNYGVHGLSSGSSGRGVFGEATSTTLGSTPVGVYGLSTTSIRGVGVSGVGSSNGVVGSSITRTDGVGVFGQGQGVGVVGNGYGSGSIAINAQGSSWFKGDTTPLNSALTGSGTGIVIGSGGNNGYIQTFDYGVFQPRILAINASLGPNGPAFVGIGTFAPNQTLEVNGRARITSIPTGSSPVPLCFNAPGDLINCNGSSLRFKKNVQRYSGGLNILRKLNPISFDWKEGGAADIGLAAEDVAKVAPFFTFRNNDGLVEGVRYERLNMVLINAVKELQANTEAQQKQIDLLIKQNAQQQKQIRDLTRSRRPMRSRHR